MSDHHSSLGREYALFLLKPDAVKAGIVQHVLNRITSDVRGHIRAERAFLMTPELLQKHYAHLVHETFFAGIQRFMLSGPVWAAIIEGEEGTIQRIRTLLGATDPREAVPGTIRNEFGCVVDGEKHNVAHASDSQEAAYAEIRRFFTEEQLRREVPELAELLFGKQY
ncbi:MAG: nucleoside-diphosphate kinase [Candidatus Peribacter sp.]|nr:nucleoside-diphosphate kinase [Candidatus Peribacter sp.]